MPPAMPNIGSRFPFLRSPLSSDFPSAIPSDFDVARSSATDDAGAGGGGGNLFGLSSRAISSVRARNQAEAMDRLSRGQSAHGPSRPSALPPREVRRAAATGSSITQLVESL